jgi:hypothetical protein
MNNKLTHHGQTVFEQIKEIDDKGNEFLGGRKLSEILEYSEYRHFLPMVKRILKGYYYENKAIYFQFEFYLVNGNILQKG